MTLLPVSPCEINNFERDIEDGLDDQYPDDYLKHIEQAQNHDHEKGQASRFSRITSSFGLLVLVDHIIEGHLKEIQAYSDEAHDKKSEVVGVKIITDTNAGQHEKIRNPIQKKIEIGAVMGALVFRSGQHPVCVIKDRSHKCEDATEGKRKVRSPTVNESAGYPEKERNVGELIGSNRCIENRADDEISQRPADVPLNAKIIKDRIGIRCLQRFFKIRLHFFFHNRPTFSVLVEKYGSPVFQIIFTGGYDRYQYGSPEEYPSDHKKLPQYLLAQYQQADGVDLEMHLDFA